MRINCHCHIFSLDCVPEQFRQRFLLKPETAWQRLVHRIVRAIVPRQTLLGDWLGFIDLSIAKIAERLVAEMDAAGIDLCTPLMMDMAYCEGFGGATKSFEEQLAETEAAVAAVNAASGRTRMLPFVAADPRRPDVVHIVCDALEGGAFKGVKVYPVMGFEPTDRRLYPIYDYCAAHRVPVTAHCENGGIPGLAAYYHLADPTGWAPVLADFPSLILNLAHHDRTGSRWQGTIEGLILACENVYTDLSFDTEMWWKPRRYFRNVQRVLSTPKLRDRVLYGTDWYMGRCFWTEASYIAWFTDYARRIPWCRVTFTDQELRLLTEGNPRRFLGLPSPDESPQQDTPEHDQIGALDGRRVRRRTGGRSSR